VGLIRVPGLIRRVKRGRAPAQQFDGPFGPPDLPDGPQGQARGPRHPSFHRAPGPTARQWLTATEIKDSSGSLFVCQVCSIMGERDDRTSNVNNSVARFMTTSTGDGR